MERLTIDTKILFCDIAQCREMPGGRFCEDGYCDQRRVYERLREYERFSDRWKQSIEQMDTVFRRVNALGGTDLMAQYRDIGDIDELTDLVKARDEGRVVVLPCKVGDTVWRIKAAFSYYSEPKEEAIDRFSFSDDGVNVLCMSGYKFRIGRFGKTVFLTRAEAEAALKGENDGDS